MKIARLGCLLGGAVLGLLPILSLAGELPMYFTPEWKEKATQAKEIAEVMAKSSGLDIRPRVVGSNADLMAVFNKKEPAIVYVGSLITTLLNHQGLATSLSQGITGKEMYSSVLVVPTAAGDNAEAIVKDAGAAISYARGASSGELGAKAASAGQANIAANNHQAALNAVKAGKAKAAFVKNWWWDGNKDKFPELKMMEYPGVSDHKNPDNVLSVSKSVTAEDAAKVKKAAADNAAAFGVGSFKDFDPSALKDTKDLMSKAKVDPGNYVW